MSKIWSIIFLGATLLYAGFVGNYIVVHIDDQKQDIIVTASSSAEEIALSSSTELTASSLLLTTSTIIAVSTTTQPTSTTSAKIKDIAPTSKIVQCGNELVNCITKNIPDWESCPKGSPILEYVSIADFGVLGAKAESTIQIEGILNGQCIVKGAMKEHPKLFLPEEAKAALKAENLSEKDALAQYEKNIREEEAKDPNNPQYPMKTICKYPLAGFKKEFSKNFSNLLITGISVTSDLPKTDPNKPECITLK
jgi:hypothetical protein